MKWSPATPSLMFRLRSWFPLDVPQIGWFDLLHHPRIWRMYSGILPAVQTYWQFIFNMLSCYRWPVSCVILCFLQPTIPRWKAAYRSVESHVGQWVLTPMQLWISIFAKYAKCLYYHTVKCLCTVVFVIFLLWINYSKLNIKTCCISAYINCEQCEHKTVK